jgi:hypothetical protein
MTTMLRRYCLTLAVLFAALAVGQALCPPCAFAQAETAIVSGRVTDQQDAVVPDVEVEIKNVATGVSRTTKTNGEGFYTFPSLEPGNYLMNVRKQQFRTVSVTGITLNVQDSLSRNFVLQVGSSAESITVTADSLNVNTTDAAVSTVVDRNFVELLPLNGRSFNTLLQLTPGVVIVPSNPEMPGQFSSNGQRSNSNYFQVDGVSANFGVTPQANLYQAGGGGTQAFNAYGGTSSLVSVDAMQEFRVETSSFAPEFGHTPGAQVLITTRSGTNRFHGTAFDYLRNTVFDANDWFANRAGQPRAAEQQNDFGGVLGGPIWRDKTFFFFSFEGLRLLQPQTSVITVPSGSTRASAVPVAAAVLNAYPQPNGPILGDGSLAQFTGVYSNHISMDAVSLRLDHSFGHGVGIFGRINWSPSESVSRVDSLTEVRTTPTNTKTVTFGLNEQISSRIFNSMRFNFSRQTAGAASALDAFGGATPLDLSLLLPDPYTSSNNLAGITPFDASNFLVGRQSKNVESQFTVLDDLSVTKGTHQFKVGADYRQLDLSAAGIPMEANYVFFTTESFASSGTPFETFFQSIRPGKVFLRNISTFFQDTWAVNRHVTLTYGLRWEVNPTPSASSGTVLAAWEDVNNPQSTTLAPEGTPIFRTTYANFAPRIGLAYRVNQKGDFVMRGGWGIFYDQNTSIAPELFSSFPNIARAPFFFIPFPDPNFSSHASSLSFSTQPPFNSPFITAFDPNLKLPYSYQWNLSIEKTIADRQSLSVAYVGQTGRRLLRQEGISAPNPNLPQGYVLINNEASSNYNALQVQYKRPLYRSVQALVNYTWSHSIDTGSDDFFTAISSAISPVSGDRGSSNFDVRQNFTGTLVYALPTASKNAFLHNLTGNWSLATVFNIRSGLPIDISTNQFFPAITRPNFDPTQPIWIPDPTTGPGKELNPLAFPVPSTPQQGNLPRNIIYGPGAAQVDISVQRGFPFRERVRLDFRMDAFNVVNHPNFANPVGTVGEAQFGQFVQMLNKGLFGLSPLYQIGGPRSLQLSLRLSY